MEQDPNLLFREIQRFRQPALWCAVVLFGVALIGAVSYPLASSLLLGHPARGASFPDASSQVLGALTILLIAGFPALLGTARLVVEVRLDGLYFRFHPFQRSSFKIAPEQLKHFELKSFKSVRDLRNWKSALAPGNILTVSGNRGVFLELAGGQSWFLGSQRPEQLAQAIVLAFKIPKCKRMETGC
ncbi:MAG: hypothetical protein HY579_12325 [Nitrospinae bacterium]|nr:hypothetical protein [Nitrospinota bacterium]